MEFIIISGLSGAGKSKVASFLEDIGFYVVDNMPAPLMPKFAELCMAGPGRRCGTWCASSWARFPAPPGRVSAAGHSPVSQIGP